jgi:hypothetical protein
MKSLELDALVDEQGRLLLDAPIPLPPGRVRITVDVSEPDDEPGDAAFRALAAGVWAESLADPGEDLYTIADGVPIDPVTGEAAHR